MELYGLKPIEKELDKIKIENQKIDFCLDNGMRLIGSFTGEIKVIRIDTDYGDEEILKDFEYKYILKGEIEPNIY